MRLLLRKNKKMRESLLACASFPAPSLGPLRSVRESVVTVVSLFSGWSHLMEFLDLANAAAPARRPRPKRLLVPLHKCRSRKVAKPWSLQLRAQVAHHNATFAKRQDPRRKDLTVFALLASR